MAIDLGNEKLNTVISEGMSRVETLLHSQLAVEEPLLRDKITHLALAGGKRFRPMFALLAAQYGSHPSIPEVDAAAVVVELTHLATLYHDDVMDEADRRRGEESANARWSNSMAILSGDYLFAIASDMMADLGVDTVRHFAATFRELVTGQMRETVGAQSGEDDIEHYMRVIQEKTGVLIASAGFLGAHHSGASEEIQHSLFRFGRQMGQIFQIIDDIIDIWSDPEQSGKTPGTDLREGVFTLPVLYAMKEDSPQGERLREILTGPVAEDSLVEEALELIRSSDAKQACLDSIGHYRRLADQELEQLPDNDITTALRELMDFSLRRLG